MGKRDTVTKDYMSEPEHFADAFNYHLYGGKQVIRPEKLSVMDPTEIAIILDDENKEVVQKIRDVLKQCILMEDDKAAYLILGIENHSEIHYAASVKNMIYDALNYGKQVSQMEKKHRANHEFENSREFLSGFKKTDKLKPVITLTIYFGADEWDAPRCLKEMFDDIDPYLLQYVTEFGKVMKFISVSKNKGECAKLMDDKMFENVGKEAVKVINECTGANIEVPEGEESINMCEGLRKLREDDIATGVQLAKSVYKLHNKGKSNEEIAKECNISLLQVEEILE